MYTSEYLDMYINTMLVDTRTLIMINNQVLINVLAILFIGYITKILVFRRDKLEVKENVWAIIKLGFIYMITGSLSIICSYVYNLEKSITSNLIADIFIVVGILWVAYFAVAKLIYMFYPKLISIISSKKEPIVVPKTNILEDEFSKKENAAE